MAITFWPYSSSTSSINVQGMVGDVFTKQDRATRLLELSGTTLQTSQKASVGVEGTVVTVESSVAVTLPTLTSHTDYLVYCHQDGSLSAQPWDDTIPTNARMVGGFHVYHTTTTINPNSIWDIGYRPSANPRGMTQCPTGEWIDIYLMDVDYGLNGYSRGGATIANANNLPKIPAFYGGNGTTTYTKLSWFEAVDLASAAGKRLLTYPTFTAAAYGVTEGTSAGTAPVNTQYQANHRSACGLEQATGCMWQWGADINGSDGSTASSWQDVAGGRGNLYMQNVRTIMFGAQSDDDVNAGSRAAYHTLGPGGSGANISARACCDHVIS